MTSQILFCFILFSSFMFVHFSTTMYWAEPALRYCLKVLLYVYFFQEKEMPPDRSLTLE